ECLSCHILELNSKYILNKGEHTTTILSQYPRTWGQTMILLNSHKISVSEITKEEWIELTEKTRMAAVILETTLKPLRCYIASLGSVENLPNTCPHIHFNVIPIYNSTDTPSGIFTWEQGVIAANENEWNDLFDRLKLEWKK
ncbi:MAG: HIT family protein, partial [Bacteroidia bacterium]